MGLAHCTADASRWSGVVAHPCFQDDAQSKVQSRSGGLTTKKERKHKKTKRKQNKTNAMMMVKDLTQQGRIS